MTADGRMLISSHQAGRSNSLRQHAKTRYKPRTAWFCPWAFFKAGRIRAGPMSEVQSPKAKRPVSGAGCQVSGVRRHKAVGSRQEMVDGEAVGGRW
jgi:hypothetical protein